MTTREEKIDQHLDAVLRASGSALRYYCLPKTLSDMRAAMSSAMGLKESAAEEGDERAKFHNWISKAWPMLIVDYSPLMEFYKGDDGAAIQDKWEGWSARSKLGEKDQEKPHV